MTYSVREKSFSIKTSKYCQGLLAEVEGIFQKKQQLHLLKVHLQGRRSLRIRILSLRIFQSISIEVPSQVQLVIIKTQECFLSARTSIKLKSTCRELISVRLINKKKLTTIEALLSLKEDKLHGKVNLKAYSFRMQVL